jgi:ABC-type glycerol-3-phosphate transport system permease component
MTTQTTTIDDRRLTTMRHRPSSIVHRRWVSKVAQTLLVILVGLLFFVPFVWMVAASLKTSKDVFTIPPTFIPQVPRYATINGQPFPMFTLSRAGLERSGRRLL